MKTNIKVNVGTNNGISQKRLDRLVSEGAINLSGIKTTTEKLERKEIITKKKQINFCRKYFQKFVLSLFALIVLFGFILPVMQSDAYYIENIGEVPDFLYYNLKIECDNTARDSNHCLKTGLSIAYAESTWGLGGISYNYFGLTSYDKSIGSWVMRYNKYWYKSTDGSFFYGYNGNAGKSHYCMSEESSGSVGWCPNGLKNFNFIYYNY